MAMSGAISPIGRVVTRLADKGNGALAFSQVVDAIRTLAQEHTKQVEVHCATEERVSEIDAKCTLIADYLSSAFQERRLSLKQLLQLAETFSDPWLFETTINAVVKIVVTNPLSELRGAGTER
jgi:hypothetical protein